MRDLFPHDQESIENTRQRIKVIQEEAEAYVSSGRNKFTYGPGARDAKMALVGHSMFFKIMNTDKQFWEEIYDIED